MFKKITIAVALTLMALLAKADFLYWQVAPEQETSFSVANLYVIGGAHSEKHLVEGVLADGVDLKSSFSGTQVSPTQTSIDGYVGSQYSFFVELVTYTAATVNGDGTFVKQGCPWTYDDLVSNGYISAGGISTPTAGMLSGGPNMASPVPEPTSGILLLIGGAMLALRRRCRA